MGGTLGLWYICSRDELKWWGGEGGLGVTIIYNVTSLSKRG